MSSSRKPLSQIAAELGLPADASEALVAAIAEQVRAQLQAEHQAALAQREAEVAAQVRAEVTAEVTTRLTAEHVQQMIKLHEELRLQRRQMFGSRSEAHAGQYCLFNEAELALAEEPDAPETAGLPACTEPDTSKDTQPAKPPKARGKRKPIPAELPRVTVVHELPENERLCPCGTPMVEIGRDVSEQLDVIPMQVRVLRHERVRYGCPDKTTAPRTALLPPQILPRSNASPNLLAMLLTVKYVDGLPLARFAKVMERSGVTLPRQTQARWVIDVARQLQPLANLILDELLECRVLHMDETTVQVLKEPERKATTKSYMWVMCSGAHESRPLILYDYRTTRSGHTVKDKLEGWQGHLMADDYSGYNTTRSLKGVVRLTCLAHVRRYFVKAKNAQVKTKAGLADEALALIGALYRIERKLNEQDLPLLQVAALDD
ncbi:MAG: IS66 family transposase [Pigmentiphaga sp.]|nr:IS66 family transposase [Pigmentiphaga sp.]